MKGFTDKAIILLPRFGVYNAKPGEWQRLFKLSVSNMVKFLKMNEIEAYTFNTDDISDLMGIPDLKQLDLLTQEDRLLLETFFLDGKKAPSGEPISQDIIKETTKKYPVKRGTSKEEKLAIFEKRDKFISRKLIEQSKLVISWEVKSGAYYKVESKEGDQRIIVNVSPLNFSIEASLSGIPVDVIDIFNYTKARSPLHTWEVG